MATATVASGVQVPRRMPPPEPISYQEFLAWVDKENLGRFHANYLDGPADLVVEVISPESRGRDRGEKFYEYEQGGVKEYWLIDPDRCRAEFYRLGPDGFYQSVPIGSDGRYESLVLQGLGLRVQWLWQRPLPTLPEILKGWQVP